MKAKIQFVGVYDPASARYVPTVYLDGEEVWHSTHTQSMRDFAEVDAKSTFGRALAKLLTETESEEGLIGG